MALGLFDRYRVIDVDTHISEPPGVWTERVSKKWGDLVPHVVHDAKSGKDFWAIGQRYVMPTAVAAVAGFDKLLPEYPDTLADAVPGAHDARARLAHMDREKIHAQVLYPNLGGFGSGGFLRLKEPELMLECVRAYNDFLIDWCSADAGRLIPVCALPFWDVAACVGEIQRCAKTGHKAVLFGSQPDSFGQPKLPDRHWDPVFSAAQDCGLSMSFHIGAGDVSDLMSGLRGMGIRTGIAHRSSLLFLENAHCLADLVFGGICHRFPRLRFVSVESGAGWVPATLEVFDWQWQNNGVRSEHPEYDLLPSEYFRRQIYACFWFEEHGIHKAIELYPDNLLYETDFPHPTSMAPGPVSIAEHPAQYAERVLGRLPEPTLRKILHANAAALYRVD